jgi:hypothetical protein
MAETLLLNHTLSEPKSSRGAAAMIANHWSLSLSAAGKKLRKMFY